jgi:hypothetical protein
MSERLGNPYEIEDLVVGGLQVDEGLKNGIAIPDFGIENPVVAVD